jgi:hypothetical protein
VVLARLGASVWVTASSLVLQPPQSRPKASSSPSAREQGDELALTAGGSFAIRRWKGSKV